MSTLVKGQHVVWANLLRGWEGDGRFWCLRQREGKLFGTKSTSIAKETFFYRVSELTGEDRARLDQITQLGGDPRLRALNQGWIDWVQRVFDTKAKLDTPGVSEADRETIGEELLVLEKNMVEKWHAGVERRATGPLDQLRAGKTDFYDDTEQRNAWITFVAFQYFRTSSLKNEVKASAGALWTEAQERTWPLETLIFSTNVGAGMASRDSNYGCALLENSSGIGFITGDQPIVNLRSEKDAELQLFVPVSPRYGLLMGPADEIGARHRTVSRLEVERLNHKIYSRSWDQIYGSDPDYLRALGKLDKLP